MKAGKTLKIIALILGMLFVFAASVPAVYASDGMAQPPAGRPAENATHAASLHTLVPSLMAVSNAHILHLSGAHGDAREGASAQRATARTAQRTLLWLALLLSLLLPWHVVSAAPLPGKKKPLIALSMGGNSPPAPCA